LGIRNSELENGKWEMGNGKWEIQFPVFVFP